MVHVSKQAASLNELLEESLEVVRPAPKLSANFISAYLSIAIC